MSINRETIISYHLSLGQLNCRNVDIKSKRIQSIIKSALGNKGTSKAGNALHGITFMNDIGLYMYKNMRFHKQMSFPSPKRLDFEGIITNKLERPETRNYTKKLESPNHIRFQLKCSNSLRKDSLHVVELLSSFCLLTKLNFVSLHFYRQVQ